MHAKTLRYHALVPRIDYPRIEDNDLVTAYITGDGGAFDELVRRYRPRLLNFIHGAICDRETAEDLVQETLVRVHRHIRRFDRTKKFSTWIFHIASNMAKNELRNRSRGSRGLLILFQTYRSDEGDDRPFQFEDRNARPDDMYHKAWLCMLVEQAVAKLPEHHRQVFELRDLEGRAYVEIAEIAGCNLGTVKSRLHRARNAFAALVEPYID